MKNLFFLVIFPVLLGAEVNPSQSVVQPCYKADVIFVIDYSGSMSNYTGYYEPWLRATAGELPLSHSLKAGLIFFSDDVCPVYCELTDDKMLFDEKIIQARDCRSGGTFLEPALIKADELFDKSEQDREEPVPRIIIVVTDSDVTDHIEACQFIYSEMTDVFFVVIDLKYKEDMLRIEMMIDCMTQNGILFDGFVWIYEDLLKNFDPCM